MVHPEPTEKAVLYYSRGSSALAAHVLLEEIGAPFEARRLDATKGENRTPEFLKLHPRGHVPVLVEGDFVLTEAAAIMVYLADRHPDKNLIPVAGSPTRARLHEWCGFLASAVHVAFRNTVRPDWVSADAAAHDSIKAYGRAALERFYAEIEARLVQSGGPWALGGAYSLVDPYLLVFYRWGFRVNFDMKRYDRWSTHANALLARPAVQRAMDREELTLTALKPAAT